MNKKIFAAIAAGIFIIPSIAQNYKMVVTTTDGQKSEYETAEINTIRFEEAPQYADLTHVDMATYTTKGDFASYYIILSSQKPDEWGLPPEVGDVEISFELIGAASESYIDAVLPEGYYRAGTGANPGEVTISRCGLTIRLAEGEDGTTVYPVADATVDVRHVGEDYQIKVEVSLLSGESAALAYSGPIKFSPGLMEAEEFTEDQDFKFTGAQARLFSNWFYPFVSDITLEFYTGEFSAEGSQIEGYWLNLDTFMPKLENPGSPDVHLVDGVYSAEPREKIANYTNVPYSYTKGHTIDMWGTLYPTGSYINLREKSGRSRRGYIVDGTMTVSNNGTDVVFDFITDNGKKIHATYSGKILISNRYNPDEVPDLSGTLTEDMKLDFIPSTVAMSYPLTDYIKSDLYQFQVMVTEPNMRKGHFIMLELSADSRVLPDGLYTIDNSLEPFSGIIGGIDYGGNLLYSWFGDLDSTDDDGVQSIIAPIYGGTVNITTTGEGTRKMEFNLTDDKGFKISGEYEGIFYDLPEEGAANAPAKKVLLR